MLIAACGGQPLLPRQRKRRRLPPKLQLKKQLKKRLLSAAAAAPAAAGCGGRWRVMLPEVNPLEVSGDIITAGSSTVFPLAERMAERFIDEGYAGNITIDSIGHGRRFRALLQGGRDGHIECDPADPRKRDRELRSDWAHADRVSRGDGCAWRWW